MSKTTMLLAAGAGYVLGARAGRERYEKISAQSEQLWQDPRVQKYVEQAKGLAGQKAREATDATKDKLGDITGNSTGRSAGTGPEVTTAADPGSVDDTDNDTVGTSGTGPQGNLP
jgi:hypothetical protein